VVVIKLEVAQQSLSRVNPAIKPGFLQRLVNAAIEPFHHAIGL